MILRSSFSLCFCLFALFGSFARLASCRPVMFDWVFFDLFSRVDSWPLLLLFAQIALFFFFSFFLAASEAFVWVWFEPFFFLIFWEITLALRNIFY